MAYESPNYVQGNYSVAERDAIFDKAKLYPDPAGALQNQVPTIMPDGSIAWRQQSSGGETGTANANLAVVEETQYASKNYDIGELMVFGGQLSRVLGHISVGDRITSLDLEPARIDLAANPNNGKGKNLFRNWFWVGGGSQLGGGKFPINQRGVTQYTGEVNIFDGWAQTGGTTTINTNYVTHAAPADRDSELYQIIETPVALNVDNIGDLRSGYTFSLLINGSIVVGHGRAAYSSDESFYQDENIRLFVKVLNNSKIRAAIHVYAGKTVNIKAVKLEMGGYSTLAQETNRFDGFVFMDVPDYGEELAKCQRYLLKLNQNTAVGGVVAGRNTVYLFIPTPATMTGTPVLLSALFATALATYLSVGFTLAASTQATVYDNMIQLTVPVADTGTDGWIPAQVYIGTDVLISSE